MEHNSEKLLQFSNEIIYATKINIPIYFNFVLIINYLCAFISCAFIPLHVSVKLADAANYYYSILILKILSELLYCNWRINVKMIVCVHNDEKLFHLQHRVFPLIIEKICNLFIHAAPRFFFSHSTHICTYTRVCRYV